MVMQLGDSAVYTVFVCVSEGVSLCTIDPHLPSLLLGTILPDLLTHLTVLLNCHLASVKTSPCMCCYWSQPSIVLPSVDLSHT